MYPSTDSRSLDECHASMAIWKPQKCQALGAATSWQKFSAKFSTINPIGACKEGQHHENEMSFIVTQLHLPIRQQVC
jgi:hypothetical protein